ncbi:MAG: biotin transporter BioY [Clostridiales bacterium]|nr:biotin transporter BioY [Clostridiales bacterium]
MQKTTIRKMVLCALFAALTAVLSQISIPIGLGLVPINLATFAVFCAGALLGSKLSPLSFAVWAVLGAVGVPVFAGFRGGLGALFGPTGGYIIGYIPAAFITGLLIEKFNRNNKILLYFAAMLAGMLTYFILGTAWYMVSVHVGLWRALMACVIPFLPGDFIKMAAAAFLAKKLRPILLRMESRGEAGSH